MSVRRRRYRRDPVAVQARLGRYTGRGGPGREVQALQAAWPQAAGPQGAANSVVVRYSRAGVASVACASGLWAQELDARRDDLADRLRRAVPDVPLAGLRFVVGDHVIPGAGEPRKRSAPRPSQEELAWAEEALREVSDPALRDLLKRAAAGQAALARQKRKSLQRGKKRGRADRGG